MIIIIRILVAIIITIDAIEIIQDIVKYAVLTYFLASTKSSLATAFAKLFLKPWAKPKSKRIHGLSVNIFWS